MNYTELLAKITADIVPGLSKGITAEKLKSLFEDLAQFANETRGDYQGTAAPADNPGTPTDAVYYIAEATGTYTNFGGLAVTASDGINLLSFVPGSGWSKTVVPIDLGAYQAISNLDNSFAGGTTQAPTAELVKILNDRTKNILENAKYCWVLTDSEERIIGGWDANGSFISSSFSGDNHIPSKAIDIVEELSASSSYIWAITDLDNKICVGIKKDGTFVVTKSDTENSLFRLKNLNFLSIGDSITSMQMWQSTLAEYTKMNYLADATTGTGGGVSMGIGGSTIRPVITGLTGQNANQSIHYRADFVDIYNPDVIILFGGTNDLVGSTIGNFTDAPYLGPEVNAGDPTEPSFYSSYKGVLQKLITQNPTAKIFAMTRMMRKLNIGENHYTIWTQIKAINDAIINCCNLYSIPVIDLFTEVGFSPENLDIYYSDSVHPNSAGGIKMAELIARKIQ